MTITISRIGPNDTERARANCALFWDMRAATANLRDYLADPNCILVAAEIDGKPVGQIVGHVLNLGAHSSIATDTALL
jgi:hypothetical protein